ncbi:MAG: glycerophosphodiester phosphodiesterase [Candidatus Altimarinota bacterium]
MKDVKHFKTNTIIGHRGCDSAGQENTVAAFLKAVELGAEWVEMDIRKTRDGVLIVWHDIDVAGLRVRGTLLEELKEMTESEEMILETLEEVLKALEGKVKLDIELKESGYESEVVDLVLKYFTPMEFLVKSFLDESVMVVKSGYPAVKAGLLLGQRRRGDESLKTYLKRRWSEFFPWKRAEKCAADFLGVHWGLCKFGLHKKAARKGYAVQVWTLNSAKRIKEFMLSYAVSGIVTDKPELALKIRKDL